MSNKTVDLKQRGPVAWTLIALLVPFGLLIWFHKSRRQIDHLNQEAGRPQRLMSPWWLTGPAIAITALAFLLITILIVGAVASAHDGSSDHSHAEDTPPATTIVEEGNQDFYLDDDLIYGESDGLDDTVSVSSSSDYNFDPEETAGVLGLVFVMVYVLVYIGFTVIYIIYLIKHVEVESWHCLALTRTRLC